MTHSSGKTLPVLFVDGYICAIQSAMGNSNTQLLYQRAAQALIPDPSERQPWLAPLLSHLTYDSIERHPLDYALISLFHAGLIRNFPLETALRLSEGIGMRWWLGDPPISTYHQKNSLQHLFTSVIMEELYPWQWGALRVHHQPTKTFRDLAQLGMVTFIKALEQQSDLVWTVDQQEKQILCTLMECPFCVGCTDSCRTWWGVFEALLDWLHGTYHVNAFNRILEIDRDHSSNHHIVITILDFKLNRIP